MKEVWSDISYIIFDLSNHNHPQIWTKSREKYWNDSIWFWFWFTLIHNSLDIYSFCDSIWFYSYWFGFILIRRQSRFTRGSWFISESKIKSNQKSKVGESWFTHCRIIGWFDFESKWIANQACPTCKCPYLELHITWFLMISLLDFSIITFYRLFHL